MQGLFRGQRSATADGPAHFVDAGLSNTLRDELVTSDSPGEKPRDDVPPTQYFPIDNDRRILIGAYPSSIAALYSLIAKENVCCFVNLTSDRTYEEKWLPSMLSSQVTQKIDVLYRPMLRRDQISEDGKIVNLCREVSLWIESHPKQQRIYVHSELGYGRAGVIASIIVGDMHQLQTNDAITHVDKNRRSLRGKGSAIDDESVVPTVETNAQVEQVFRILGNPQCLSHEEDDDQGIRSESKKRLRADDDADVKHKHSRNSGAGAAENNDDDENEDEDVQGGGFAPVNGSDAFTVPSISSNSKEVAKDGIARRGILYNAETEFVALPDRSNQTWRIEADKWIMARKRLRKAESLSACSSTSSKKVASKK